MTVSRVLLIALCLVGSGTAGAVDEVQHYAARVVEKRAFDASNFTQGLEIRDHHLYVSSGLYRQSAVRVYTWPAGEKTREQALPPQLFAEGLTLMGDRLYVLTWRARRLLVLNSTTLEPIGEIRLATEGWGLTHHGDNLYYTDGSDRLYVADLAHGGDLRTILVTLNGKPLRNLNELEWINGEIWANVWLQDRIVRIDPATGQVTGDIDLSQVFPQSMRPQGSDVLNGIARDPVSGELWVTGKRWPWIFRIELEKRS